MNPSRGTKNYQRLFLRAPYNREVLLSYQNDIQKASALNLSEGGALLELKDNRFLKGDVNFMLELLEFPLFKNYTNERLSAFSVENLHSRTVRFQGKAVREIDGDFGGAIRVGFTIEKITPIDQLKISKYIENISSNLIFLQVLIDSYNSDIKQLKKIRLIADFLGYNSELKLSYLRKIIEHDYKSLQWL